MNVLKEIGELQKNYKNLLSSNKLTKKAMCELVIPFRDKYHLSDKDALSIARNEMSIDEISRIIEGE